jgi:hypothetical protein
MIFVSWFVCWIILSCIGIIGVYRAGRSIERSLPNMSLFYFVLVSTRVLAASYVTAVRLVGVEQAGCEELDPTDPAWAKMLANAAKIGQVMGRNITVGIDL